MLESQSTKTNTSLTSGGTYEGYGRTLIGCMEGCSTTVVQQLGMPDRRDECNQLNAVIIRHGRATHTTESIRSDKFSLFGTNWKERTLSEYNASSAMAVWVSASLELRVHQATHEYIRRKRPTDWLTLWTLQFLLLSICMIYTKWSFNECIGECSKNNFFVFTNINQNYSRHPSSAGLVSSGR